MRARAAAPEVLVRPEPQPPAPPPPPEAGAPPGRSHADGLLEVAPDSRTRPLAAAVDEAAGKPLVLADGTRAAIHEGGLEIRDPRGRLLIRYAGGAATIAVPDGDLTLAAPNGRVAIQSGEDVVIEAARDIRHSAARRLDLAVGAGETAQVRLDARKVEIDAKEVEIKADRSRMIAGDLEIVARTLATSADQIVETAGRVERTAQRLIERARDAFRDVAELSQSRVGRVRLLVRETYSLTARRTTLTSTEDTSIDGKRILLG